MNLGSHIIVAQRFDDDPRHWLGAALPDLASMGGFRLLGSTTDAAVTRGIGFHHRTDDAFHQHRWFTEIQLPLRATLLDAGIGRGPARAVAHVGPELLLDGALLGASPARSHAGAVEAALGALGGVRDVLGPLVRPEHRAAWQVHLDRVERWRPTDDDHRAGAVARRLHRILRRRPRLAFELDQVDLIEEKLRPVEEHIVATSDEFLTDLVGVLARP